MTLYQCLLIDNPCYKRGGERKPEGIVLHSTGANNPELRRYVQPTAMQSHGMGQVLPVSGAFSRYKVLELLGTNSNGNDWNRVVKPGVCVHGFIGRTFKGAVASVQTLPWGMPCWGCASGENGSYNTSHIQIELCEDALHDEAYLEACWREAVELCAHLCKHYQLPVGSICSHAEAYRAGYASNHGDPEHWFKAFGRSMDQFRRDVDTEILAGAYAASVKSRFGLSDKTMAYLRRYKYAAELLRKLAVEG